MSDSQTVVPENLTDVVIKFCSRVSPRQEAFYVAVKPESYCRMGYCFQNVEEKIRRDSGAVEYGWQIWMWPDVFIEAEFHAIWKSPEGEYVDITPKDVEHPTILFISDSRIVYEGFPIDNIRQNISPNQLVDLFIAATECMVLVQNFGKRAYEHAVSLSGDEAELFQYLSAWGYTLQEMLKNKISRNAECPCGSNLKFKRCCEKELIKTIGIVKKNYTK